ncbi:MAG: DUF4870 domain-containing protein [Ectobacillus sp.]
MSEFDVLTEDEKTWGMLAHLSSFLGYFTGVGFIVGPLLVWIFQKEKSKFVDREGKESLNFQVTMLIYYTVAGVLCFILIGFLLLPVLAVFQLVVTIIAAVKAKDGASYRYPLTIRFF